MNIHKLNGFIYVTSEDKPIDRNYCFDKFNQLWKLEDKKLISFDSKGIKRFSTDNILGHECRKIILTNDSYLANVQKLTPEEEAYCKTVDSVEVEYTVDFNSKAVIVIPKQETIEEVAYNYAEVYRCPATNKDEYCKHDIISAINFGYNHAVKTHYTEEEVRLMLSESFKASHEGYYTSADKIINQFNQNKKK